jgi:hypothetical protein
VIFELIFLTQAAMSINTNGGADEVLDLARCWLQTCNLTHPQCALLSEPLLPTRTISVGTCEKLPFLFSSKGSRGRYCALSYTWGAFNRNFATTFRKNLERQSQGWNMRDDEERDLPLMVRDAILITRHLGVDYLWIDAMCIVQDDPVEKASEVAKMKDIYQAAYCTLAATGSENAGHGLLRLRESLVYETRQCSFYRRSLYPSLPQKKVDVDAASINTRGWVFQESILSRRRLHWARNRIYWDCLTCSASEKNTVANKNNSIGSTPLLQTGFEPREETIFSAPLISKEATSKSFDSKYFYKIWDRWVSTYSSCHLTEATDRLIAIGGLANFMNGFLLDQYHAGLWRGNFLEGLQWYTTRPQGPDQDKKEVEGGRKPYLAPTWSWASITWPVNNIFDRNAERLGPGSWSKWESDRDNEWLYTLDIIDISTPPSGPDPCGAVTPDSKLTVSVKIRPLLQTGWIIDSQSDMHENFGFQFCDPEYTFEGLLGKDKDRRHLAKFDSRDIVPHPDEGLHCVEVCYDVDAAPKAYSAPGPGGNVISSPVHSHGLILEPVEKSDNGSLPKKWRRIGIAKLTDGSYFSRCEKTIIEIV